jgi:hypothetical protein
VRVTLARQRSEGMGSSESRSATKFPAAALKAVTLDRVFNAF